jgi:CBS domain-containing protein
MTTTFTSEEVATVAGAEHGQLRVRDLMTIEPVTVRGGAPLVVADLLMRDLGVSGLPVIDGKGALIGVLSRTDLMALAGDPRVDAWQGRSVAATMTAPGLTIGADAPLTEAAARMEEHRVHRLVVVEPEGGHPIGILSTMDLVRAVAASGGGLTEGSLPWHGRTRIGIDGVEVVRDVGDDGVAAREKAQLEPQRSLVVEQVLPPVTRHEF